MLDEVNSILEFDVDGRLPLELRERLLDFLKSPAKIFSFDSKGSIASGASECRVILKPSDGFLNFLLALRAWNREFNVTV
jgi:hypothetical protein